MHAFKGLNFTVIMHMKVVYNYTVHTTSQFVMLICIITYTHTPSALPVGVGSYGGFGQRQPAGLMSPLSSGYSSTSKSQQLSKQSCLHSHAANGAPFAEILC